MRAIWIPAVAAMLVGVAQPAVADDTLKAIKKRYAGVGKGIKAKAIKKKTVSTSFVAPGVGETYYTYRCFFEGDKLAKLSLKYNVAASAEINEEFLFGDDGRLLFFFSKSVASESCKSQGVTIRNDRRIYFNGDKVHQIREKGRALQDDNGDADECKKELGIGSWKYGQGSKRKFKKYHLKSAKKIAKRAKRYVKAAMVLKSKGKKAAKRAFKRIDK